MNPNPPNYSQIEVLTVEQEFTKAALTGLCANANMSEVHPGQIARRSDVAEWAESTGTLAVMAARATLAALGKPGREERLREALKELLDTVVLESGTFTGLTKATAKARAVLAGEEGR